MSLIELMVALGIGSFLIVGAMTVYVQSRSTYQVNDTIARLQENGRYFFDVVEPDIRMAGHWGLVAANTPVAGRASPADAPSPLAPVNDCGPNWSVDLQQPVAAANGVFDFSCSPYGTAAGASDTLVIRRTAATRATELDANTLYVQSSRNGNATLFQGTSPPAEYDPAMSESHELIVNGYYISRNSSLDATGNPVPSLRRKLLRNGGSKGPTIVDEEVLPGVDDMQIQFGIDTDAAGADNYGSVDLYVNPGSPMLDNKHAAFDPHARVLAVRIWLRLRSERPEDGVPAGTGLRYADRKIDAFNDGYRRIVISRTIFLRNSAGPS